MSSQSCSLLKISDSECAAAAVLALFSVPGEHVSPSDFRARLRKNFPDDNVSKQSRAALHKKGNSILYNTLVPQDSVENVGHATGPCWMRIEKDILPVATFADNEEDHPVHTLVVVDVSNQPALAADVVKHFAVMFNSAMIGRQKHEDIRCFRMILCVDSGYNGRYATAGEMFEKIDEYRAVNTFQEDRTMKHVQTQNEGSVRNRGEHATHIRDCTGRKNAADVCALAETVLMCRGEPAVKQVVVVSNDNLFKPLGAWLNLVFGCEYDTVTNAVDLYTYIQW